MLARNSNFVSLKCCLHEIIYTQEAFTHLLLSNLQELRAGGQPPPLRASENQFPPQGFPGPSSQSGFPGVPSRLPPPTSVSATPAGGGLNNLDGPGVGATPRQGAPLRGAEPVGLGGNPPNQLNNLNQPPPQVCT